MTAPVRLERKVRITLAVAIMLLLVGPALLLHNFVSSRVTARHLVASAHAPNDSRLVELKNGTTMLLASGSFSQNVFEWLQLKKSKQTAFAIADSNFKPASADPSLQGANDIAHLAHILKADPHLRAKVVLPRPSAADTAAVPLARSRAESVLVELMRRGVPAATLSSATEGPRELAANHVADNSSLQQSGLFMVLSRR